jgi:tetratricopeptide (TPR) repeat protein
MRRATLLFGLCLLAGLTSLARAENEGQDDLDKATQLKVSAESMADLAEVIRLAESAMKAGLDDENKKFANELLVGTLLQRAEAVSAKIFEQGNPPLLWPQMRKLALADLEKVVAANDKQAEAYFLIGRLNSLPDGDRRRGLEALNKAVELSKDEHRQLARALVLRAQFQREEDKREQDFNQAVELAPQNAEIIRTRGLYWLARGKPDDALADLDKALELEPESAEAHEARGVALMLSQKLDEALEALNKAIELNPDSPTPLTHKARILATQNKTDEALQQIEAALKLDPHSAGALLLRARIYQQSGDLKKAKLDVEHVLRAQPGQAQALQMRALLAAGTGDYKQAIEDLKLLVKAIPDSVELHMQLALFYTANKQTDQAVAAYDEILEKDKENWLAYRGRADAYLNVGKHAEAVADYDAALKLQPKNSGLLNNLAWVLATSPDDKIRDGKRAIELAKQGCEVTEYKQAHVLSTLAAAYAESGNFDEAVKWSKKAVESGPEALKDQLSKELESYQAKKPWREEKPPEVDVPEDETAVKPDPQPDKPASDAPNKDAGDSDKDSAGEQQ